jgi:tetratricopeptide (TPR) repeat protein
MRQINPSLQDPYLYLSALYAKRGDTDRAVATLKDLVARNPGSVLGYYYLGRVHAAARSSTSAERYYLDALKLSPQSELILTDLAATYELQGRGDKAIELYERVLAINPRSVPVRRRLGGPLRWAEEARRGAVAVPRDRAPRRDPSEARTEDRPHLPREGGSGARRHRVQPRAGRRAGQRPRALLPRRRLRRAPPDPRAMEEFGKIPPSSEYYVDARVQRAYLLQRDGRLDEAVKEVERRARRRATTPS